MIRVGLYGTNGHQIHQALAQNPLARIGGLAGFPDKEVTGPLAGAAIRRYRNFGEMLADPEIDCVSLCSPRRRDQAAEAVRALLAGKHVLAEKPCAMTGADLDGIFAAVKKSGKIFHEMSGTAFAQPYLAMRRIVQSGRIGGVIQVVAEKSYPYHGDRPQDEDVDGGLIGQNGIHALRFVEHVACTPIASIRAVETTRGNPVAGGGLRMAASLLLTLKNGGVASLAANYLNPRGTGVWGCESLKILGDKGMVESREEGRHTRLVIGEKDLGAFDISPPADPWLDRYFRSLSGEDSMPLSLEEELSPTRWTILARNA